ncbi:hypothetical protein [Cupriavidus lacunae]|uniref:hypothetical protein n=1 Tax=Cupriavidus lacunae TaxID=2666307 RepID=UPI00142E4B88|nr:hypothetical protein [Cupriavidus lacunae]
MSVSLLVSVSLQLGGMLGITERTVQLPIAGADAHVHNVDVFPKLPSAYKGIPMVKSA